MEDVSNKLTPSISAVSKDEDRLVALYSPMRPKDLNPENWDRKTKFWVTAIEEVVQHRITFTMKELQDAFTITKRVPACLPDVIHYLHVNKDIALVKDVLAAAAQEQLNAKGWSYWPGKSIRWCVDKMSVFNPLTYWKTQPMLLTTERFVYINQIKRYSESILAHPKLQSKLMSVEEWKKEVKILTRLENDDELLFSYLNESGKVVTDTIGSTEVIKMISSSSKEPLQISDVEKKEYEVRKTKERLEEDLENLHQKQESLDTALRLALREGKRMTAKHHLRAKKLLEKRGEKLLNLVDNLSSLLLKIEDANSDALVISAYEAGKNAIDMIFKENNLTSDRVIETMLDLQDVLEKQNEITESISSSINEEDSLEDLDAELELLLKEDEQSKLKDHQSKLREDGQNKLKKEQEETMKKLNSLRLDDVDELKIHTKSKADPQASVKIMATESGDAE